MSAALETLLLAFRREGGLALPARALLLGAEAHPAFAGWADLTGWQSFKPLADDWERAGLPRVDAPTGKFPLVLVLPGKSREETLAWFALAREHLEPGGRLLAAMPNTAGAARFERELRRACGTLESIQKHKCRAFHAVEDGTWDEELFAAWRLAGQRRTLPGTAYLVEPGLFSIDHIDPGSALLAAHLPVSLRGRVADLGAGWGYLSDMALRRCAGISGIDLFEADARALDCARANLAHHPRELAFHWHDVCTGVPGNYDTILMNPPFHRGQDTRVDVGRGFIAAAAHALRRGGALYLVANRQLPYEATLDTLGLVWHPAGGDATYKLISCRKR